MGDSYPSKIRSVRMSGRKSTTESQRRLNDNTMSDMSPPSLLSVRMFDSRVHVAQIAPEIQRSRYDRHSELPIGWIIDGCIDI